jgi:hypothetical protein
VFLVSDKVCGTTGAVGNAMAAREPPLPAFNSPAGAADFFVPQAPLDSIDSQEMSRSVAKPVLDPAALNEITEMALGDHASFEPIRALPGLDPDAVKALVRQNLRTGCRAWRRPVRQFSDRREACK